MGLTNRPYVDKRVIKYYNMIPEDKYEVAGVYCIKVNEEIVYIGKAVNMRLRIANHMYHICEGYNNTSGSKFKYGELARAISLGYKLNFDVLHTSSIVERGQEQNDDIGFAEAKLINKYMPKLNKQIPSIEDYHKYKNKEYEKLEINGNRDESNWQ